MCGGKSLKNAFRKFLIQLWTETFDVLEYISSLPDAIAFRSIPQR